MSALAAPLRNLAIHYQARLDLAKTIAEVDGELARIEWQYSGEPNWLNLAELEPTFDTPDTCVYEFRIVERVGYLSRDPMPLPETDAPATGRSYYMPDPLDPNCRIKARWSGSAHDIRALECNQVYLFPDHATQVGVALTAGPTPKITTEKDQQ